MRSERKSTILRLNLNFAALFIFGAIFTYVSPYIIFGPAIGLFGLLLILDSVVTFVVYMLTRSSHKKEESNNEKES